MPSIPSDTAAVLRSLGWTVKPARPARADMTYDTALCLTATITATGAWIVNVRGNQIAGGNETSTAFAAMEANEVAWAYRNARKVA